MPLISIDIETYSDVDIRKAGAYRYVDTPNFEILMLAYKIGNAPTRIVDFARGDTLPRELVAAINSVNDTDNRLVAFNANFERTCFARVAADWEVLYGVDADKLTRPESWDCTMVHSAQLGMPMSLGEAAAVLRVPVQKMKEGTNLINYFCKPCKSTKTNGGRTRNLPEHAPEKWSTFVQYCMADVEAERGVSDYLNKVQPIRKSERNLWRLDQRINDRGLLVNQTLMRNAITIHDAYRDKLLARAAEITGLSNPNSLAQLKEWLSEELETEVTGLTKKDLPKLLAAVTDDAAVTEVLRIRQELGKTSVKKYSAMQVRVCSDSRVRGLLQYYGAIRTGRWAGRGVQVQNLPSNEFKPGSPQITCAREAVLEGDGEALELMFGNVPGTLSQLIRTSFEAPVGRIYAASDFTSIEAVVLSYLAGEEWRLQVFREKKDMYIEAVVRMFHLKREDVTKDWRQKGKIAELALGYQGGSNALESMGALDRGLQKEELQPLVDAWRKANPKIVKFWYAMNDAAIRAVRDGERVKVSGGIEFYRVGKALAMQLPSGRRLFYPDARIAKNRFDSDSVEFMGPHPKTGKWSVLSLYGGILTENAVQAMSRDLLAVAMLRLDAAGFDIVLHVHDEVVCEVAEADMAAKAEEMDKIMAEPVPWAPGLPLSAKGFLTPYYLKD